MITWIIFGIIFGIILSITYTIVIFKSKDIRDSIYELFENTLYAKAIKTIYDDYSEDSDFIAAIMTFILLQIVVSIIIIIISGILSFILFAFLLIMFIGYVIAIKLRKKKNKKE